MSPDAVHCCLYVITWEVCVLCLCVCEDPQEGVMVLLPAESQQRMVQLLYFLPKMSQSLLANLSCCCSAGRISAGLAASLIRIVHLRWAWKTLYTCWNHMNTIYCHVCKETLLFRKELFDSTGMPSQLNLSGNSVGHLKHSSLPPSDGSIALSLMNLWRFCLLPAIWQVLMYTPCILILAGDNKSSFFS